MQRAFTTIVLLLAPRAALACPVCFGQNDSPMAKAVMLGVIAMLGLVVAVLGGFATFIVHLGRRARLAADPSTTAEPPVGPDEARGYLRSDPQEGTARC